MNSLVEFVSAAFGPFPERELFIRWDLKSLTKYNLNNLLEKIKEEDIWGLEMAKDDEEWGEEAQKLIKLTNLLVNFIREIKKNKNFKIEFEEEMELDKALCLIKTKLNEISAIFVSGSMIWSSENLGKLLDIINAALFIRRAENSEKYVNKYDPERQLDY